MKKYLVYLKNDWNRTKSRSGKLVSTQNEPRKTQFTFRITQVDIATNTSSRCDVMDVDGKFIVAKLSHSM